MADNTRLIAISIIVAGALVGVGFYFGLSGQATTTVVNNPTVLDNTESGLKLNEITVSLADLKDDDPSMGSGSVLIVEFSDYACGYCARHHIQTVPSLKENYVDTGKVELVHRNFVLYALEEAKAVECADDQGKYWEYHDTLFQNRGETEGALNKYASDLGLDTAKFDACLASEEKTPELENDYNMGRALGITGTPTFMVAGQKENVNEQDLSKLLELDLSMGEYFKVFENPNEGTIIVKMVGAQAFETFQETIDALL